MILRILIFVTILSFSACNRTIDPVTCTEEFVVINLTVIDNEGLVADSVNILVYNKGDNTIYDLTGMNDPDNPMTQRGEYTIFHDGFLKQVQGKIERLVVEGEKGLFSFMAEFDVGGNECHVYKISGPDIVTLEKRQN